MATLKVPVSANDHRQGSAHAKVTLVEFGDYECPYCGEAYWMVKNLQQHFRDDLQFVFRNFPLTTAHPHAMAAAVTSRAVVIRDGPRRASRAAIFTKTSSPRLRKSSTRKSRSTSTISA